MAYCSRVLVLHTCLISCSSLWIWLRCLGLGYFIHFTCSVIHCTCVSGRGMKKGTSLTLLQQTLVCMYVLHLWIYILCPFLHLHPQWCMHSLPVHMVSHSRPAGKPAARLRWNAHSQFTTRSMLHVAFNTSTIASQGRAHSLGQFGL
jgi:hypothetical protein